MIVTPARETYQYQSGTEASHLRGRKKGRAPEAPFLSQRSQKYPATGLENELQSKLDLSRVIGSITR